MPEPINCANCGWRLRQRFPAGDPGGVYWVHAATGEIKCSVTDGDAALPAEARPPG
ncbi:hypothetical protein SAMN05444157_3527 [Frankineae bacterium MT45]|nr:hypothetical protein SAMN05444157_3527 [Frankineae bacterium MT45]